MPQTISSSRDTADSSSESTGHLYELNSERIPSQDALEQSQKNYYTLFNRIADPVFLFDKQTKLFIDFNEAALRIYGYSAIELRAMTPFDLHPPDELDKVRQNIDSRNVDQSNIYSHLTRDGSRIDVEILSDETEWQGRPAWISIVRNITKRRQVEKALEAKTEQLEAINQAIVVFLQTGEWRQATGLLLRTALDQTQSEYGFAGVIVDGPALRILAHEGIVWDSKVNRGFYEEAVRTYEEVGYLEFTSFNNLFGQVITGRKAVLSNDPSVDPRSSGLPPGHPPLRHFLGVPMLYGSEVVGMIGVANRPVGYSVAEQAQLEILAQTASILYDSYRHIQREADLEAQLHQAQKMEAIGRLAGGIAHDFNNLLTVITGYSDLLLTRLDPRDLMGREIVEINKAGRRAATLTRQLLAFSRKQPLQPKVLDLNLVIAEMEGMLRRLIGADIELVMVLRSEARSVKADPGQIEQVIMNLVINARDAMTRGGRLVIETARVEIDMRQASKHTGALPGKHIMLAVSDTGCGMDKGTLSQIFDPFFTTKESGKGTGLGLSTVYGIIKQSGGFITANSDPGVGTTFKIYLPCVEGYSEGVEIDSQYAKTRGGTETILLAEDEDGVRRLVRRILESNGYRVLEASDGEEALQISERCQGAIHLLVTDLVMPRMGGIELFQNLAQARPRMKVLYMSGYADYLALQQSLPNMEMLILHKPFEQDELTQKVREWLDYVDTLATSSDMWQA